MQKVFDEVGSLDRKCYDTYGLSEDILMEHAANSMLGFIEKKFDKDSKILIVSGSGNNGADGIALARLLQGRYKVMLFLATDINSHMGKLQLDRANKIGVNIVNDLQKCDVVVDCLFGSGLNRALSKKYQQLINGINKLDGYKIACDIPSGINFEGQISPVAVYSDVTITMGALKKSLFTDEAKEYVGKIKVANLGVQREIYEDESDCFSLEKKDLKLPYRVSKSTHKGTFGHLAVVIGEKSGAGLLACEAGFSLGSGLVTAVLEDKIKKLPNHIMQSRSLPSNTTAICIGMGLGKRYDETILENNIPKVCDADIFYDKNILNLLDKDNVVLTPHPKEFCSLLKISKITDVSIDVLQKNRFKYLKAFSLKYPKIVVLLKGANVLIAKGGKIYINTFGTNKLSKGGSGDVLGGFIGSLLAQGYNTLEAAINGSLAHTMAAQKYKKNNYSLKPQDIIEMVKEL
jgi:hydroxyethylthiazole kinase-like uncharacterized protein yjeF